MAKQAVPSFPIFAFLGKEAPINRHPSRISNYRFDVTPNQEEKDNMEYYEQYDIRFWVQTYHILVNKNEVVEGNKADDTTEMGVN